MENGKRFYWKTRKLIKQKKKQIFNKNYIKSRKTEHTNFRIMISLS